MTLMAELKKVVEAAYEAGRQNGRTEVLRELNELTAPKPVVVQTVPPKRKKSRRKVSKVKNELPKEPDAV